MNKQSFPKTKVKEGAEVALAIAITKPEKQYIAECRSLEVFSTGDTVVEAVCDLAESMKQDYKTLLEERRHLSGYLKDKLKIYQFKRKIDKKD